MKKIGVIGCIIENPQEHQALFNEIVSEYRSFIHGRMGIPFDAHDISVITITMVADADAINALTGKLGNIPGISVKTAISKKEIED